MENLSSNDYRGRRLQGRLTRRRLLIAGTFGSLGLAAAAIFGCEDEASNPEIDLTYTSINRGNTEMVAELVKKRVEKLPILEIRPIPEVSLNSNRDFEDLGRAYRELLKSHGIESFNFVETTEGELLVVLKLVDNVKHGEPFSRKQTPWPAFILTKSRDYHIVAATSGFGQNPPRNEDGISTTPIDIFYNVFPVNPKSLSNDTFVILFNAGLFNVNGRDLPSFSLPFRFQIENAPQTPDKPKGEVAPIT